MPRHPRHTVRPPLEPCTAILRVASLDRREREHDRDEQSVRDERDDDAAHPPTEQVVPLVRAHARALARYIERTGDLQERRQRRPGERRPDQDHDGRASQQLKGGCALVVSSLTAPPTNSPTLPPTAVYAGTSAGPSAFPTKKPANAPSTDANSAMLTAGARRRNAAATHPHANAHTAKVAPSSDWWIIERAWRSVPAAGRPERLASQEGHACGPKVCSGGRDRTSIPGSKGPCLAIRRPRRARSSYGVVLP